MKNQFVTYEISQKLKELGFNELSNHFYSQDGKLIPRILSSGNEPVDFEPDDFYENFNTITKYEVNGKYQHVITAPLWQQAIDWLREKHNIKVIESVRFGWDVYGEYDGEYILAVGGECQTKELAILKALENINMYNKVGKEFYFEYHCFESDYSNDAKIWYRSHQKVKVIARGQDDHDEFPDEPKTYIVKFQDGFEATVFDDELMESTEQFYRPDPPKR